MNSFSVIAASNYPSAPKRMHEVRHTDLKVAAETSFAEALSAFADKRPPLASAHDQQFDLDTSDTPTQQDDSGSDDVERNELLSVLWNENVEMSVSVLPHLDPHLNLRLPQLGPQHTTASAEQQFESAPDKIPATVDDALAASDDDGNRTLAPGLTLRDTPPLDGERNGLFEMTRSTSASSMGRERFGLAIATSTGEPGELTEGAEGRGQTTPTAAAMIPAGQTLDVTTAQIATPALVSSVRSAVPTVAEAVHSIRQEIVEKMMDLATAEGDRTTTSPLRANSSAVVVPKPDFNGGLENHTELLNNTWSRAEFLHTDMADAVDIRPIAAPGEQVLDTSTTRPFLRAQTPLLAQHLAEQMSVSMRTSPGNMTEMALDPMELGRVRMTMTVHEQAIVLSIAAERPETADLMRRHVDILQQEFRALGYTSVTLDFEAAGQQAGFGESSQPDQIETEAAASQDVDDPIQGIEYPSPSDVLGAARGLDLRM